MRLEGATSRARYCYTMLSAELAYAVLLDHHGSESIENGFATMREAEGLIKRNTPAPQRKLSALYDGAAGDG